MLAQQLLIPAQRRYVGDDRMEKWRQTPQLRLLIDIYLLHPCPHHGIELVLVPEMLPVGPCYHIILILHVELILLELENMGWAQRPRKLIAYLNNLPLH